MTQKNSLQLREDRRGFLVHGEINFANVTNLRQLGKQLLAECVRSQAEIDLGAVTKVDNVGLALLTAWLRDAAKLQKAISYKNVPNSLQQMAVICGVNDVIR